MSDERFVGFVDAPDLFADDTTPCIQWTARDFTNVVHLDDHRPHEVGTVECRACHYRHVSVIPVRRAPGGSECPRCGEFECFFLRVDGTLDDS